MIETVLFDLDGTILDTNELIIASFKHVFEDSELPVPTRERLIEHMGRPLEEQLRFFANRSKEESVEDLRTAYRTYNLARHDEMVQAFPYVKETIEALRAKGLRIGVVTSKIRLTTEKGLRLCGLADYMETVITVDDVALPKPDPAGILEACRQLGIHPQSAIMVGDSPMDMQAAASAGATAVGVAWSLKDRAALKEAGADYMIDDMRELLELTKNAGGLK